MDLADAAPARLERETDVPVGLQAASENGEGVHDGAPGEKTGGGQSGAEGREVGGLDEGVGLAGGCEEGEG